MKTTKLYNVPRNTKVRTTSECFGPVGSITVEKGEEILLVSIDGMYSHCRNSRGEIVHLPAVAEVEIV